MPPIKITQKYIDVFNRPPIKITQKYIDAFIEGYNPLYTRFSFHPNPTDGWEKWENEQAKIYST